MPYVACATIRSHNLSRVEERSLMDSVILILKSKYKAHFDDENYWNWYGFVTYESHNPFSSCGDFLVGSQAAGNFAKRRLQIIFELLVIFVELASIVSEGQDGSLSDVG